MRLRGGKMIVGFRVDANENVATGHIMRCITIAKHCRSLGADCIFFLAENKFTELLHENELPYRVLDIDYREWDGNFELMSNAFRAAGLDKLIIDSYLVTPKFLLEIKKQFPTLYFDDVRDRIYPATLVVSYSIWSETDHPILRKYQEAGVEVLWSPRYCPLRDEFSTPTSIERERRVLILTGGSDPHHVTLSLIRRLLLESDLGILAVLGRMNFDREAIAELARENPTRLSWKQNVKNVAELMRGSAFAISAGGITLYELCACGTPTVCFAMNDEQAYLCMKMRDAGMMKYAGNVLDGSDNVIDGIVLSMKELATDEEFQNRAAEKMRRVVDGKGALRIAEAVIKLQTGGDFH